MRAAAVILLLISAVLARSGDNAKVFGLLTTNSVIEIEHCHQGDRAVIHVDPLHPDARHCEGWFETTNTALSLRDLTMLPDGTNAMEIRTVCRGMTSAVSTILVEIRRPPPAPRVSRRRVLPPSPLPPTPPGVITALPGGHMSASYAAYRQRLDRIQTYQTLHRSN